MGDLKSFYDSRKELYDSIYVGDFDIRLFNKVGCDSLFNVKDSFYLIQEHTGEKILRLVSFPYYINLETMNILSNPIKGGKSIVVTNLNYILSKLGYSVERDQILKSLENAYLNGDSEVSALNNLGEVSLENSSVIHRILKEREPDKFIEVADTLRKSLDLYDDCMVTIKKLVDSTSDIYNYINLCAWVRNGVYNSYTVNFEYRERIKRFYYLLRAVNQDFSFLYLKMAPSLYNKIVQMFNLEGTASGIELSKASKDFAYNQKFSHLIINSSDIVDYAESLFDLGEVIKKINK